jgi:UDPglucose 6-dehydrogenase
VTQATSVGVVGKGALGSAVADLFLNPHCYDKPLGVGSRSAILGCDFVFVCVPTPTTAGGSCDLTEVEDVFSWLTSAQIILCSTVPVGTTDRLRSVTHQRIVFQPMHGPGETPHHPYARLEHVPWVVLGGPPDECASVADLYKSVLNSSVSFHLTDAATAELSKYMGNAFLATKVAFCNEFFDLARAWGVDYDVLREVWLQDPRIGRSHTFVHRTDRGFGGKCLPKDLSALVAAARLRLGRAPILLNAVLTANNKWRHSDDRKQR